MSIKGTLRKFRRKGSGNEVLELIRYGVGTYERDGIYSAVVKERRRLSASIQPITERTPNVTDEMLTRRSSYLVCYSPEEMFPNDEQRGIRADQLKVGSRLYTVTGAYCYQYLSLQHWQVFLKEENA